MELSIGERLVAVRQRIEAAARRGGRSAQEITLVAVSKRHPASAVEDAIAAGIRDFGENYVQEADAKRAAVGEREGVRWHLIGGLQSNKARRAVELFDCIQTLDSQALTARLGRLAVEAGKVVSVLVEVNLAGSEGRSGAVEDDALRLCAVAAATPGLALRGLMGVAPIGREAEEARPHFARLYSTYKRLPAENRHILSMGMSGDFEIAIEEGATLIRVGTALFGERPQGRSL